MYIDYEIILKLIKTNFLVFERNEERAEFKFSVNGKMLEKVNEVGNIWEVFSIEKEDRRWSREGVLLSVTLLGLLMA